LITIRLISKSSGRPVKGKKVALGIDALLSAGVTHGKWTDEEGEASFNVDPNYGQVLVSGSTEFKGYLQGTITVRI
jgi:hypothetical protein